MSTVGFIDNATTQEAMAAPVNVAPSQTNNNQFAPYYVDAVNRAVENAQLGVDNEQNMRVQTTIDPDLQHKLDMTVQELDLSVRANNCLESAKIQTVRDLVQKTDTDLLKVRSFGKTSLREVKRKLADMGLSLGMDLNQIPSIPEGGDDADMNEPEGEEAEAAQGSNG